MATLRLYISSAVRGGPLVEMCWMEITTPSLEATQIFDTCTIKPDGSEETICRIWESWEEHDPSTNEINECRLLIPEEMWETFTRH